MSPSYDIRILTSGKELVAQGAHSQKITAMELNFWNEDEYLYTGGLDNTLQVWEIER